MDKQNFFFQIVHLGSPGEKKKCPSGRKLPLVPRRNIQRINAWILLSLLLLCVRAGQDQEPSSGTGRMECSLQQDACHLQQEVQV